VALRRTGLSTGRRLLR